MKITFFQGADVYGELNIRECDVDRIVFGKVHEHHSSSGRHFDPSVVGR